MIRVYGLYKQKTKDDDDDSDDEEGGHQVVPRIFFILKGGQYITSYVSVYERVGMYFLSP